MRVLFALMSLFAFGLQADSIKRADEPRDTTIKVIVWDRILLLSSIYKQ